MSKIINDSLRTVLLSLEAKAFFIIVVSEAPSRVDEKAGLMHGAGVGCLAGGDRDYLVAAIAGQILQSEEFWDLVNEAIAAAVNSRNINI